MLSQGLNFVPGSKLEAKDFNEKWYAARVVETDWIEREVLIHFDKWSTRFDEWIPMDSSRLRVSTAHPKESKSKIFVAGEKILATWVDGKKYPAKVTAVLGNDKYDVLFDDGYSKILKTSKITKLVEGKTPLTPPVQKELVSNIRPGYLGTKQERRDKKRKHSVSDLFYTHSKKKIKNSNDKKQGPMQMSTMKFDYKPNFQDPPLQSEIKTEKIEGTQKFYPNFEPTTSKQITENPEEGAAGHFNNDYATFVGNLRVEIEDSTYKCPKTGCNKNFRKENLLQMHIKHYHPEYSKFLGSTPNVADLAYARTIGESFDELNPKKLKNYPPQSTFVQDSAPFNLCKNNPISLETDQDFKNENVIDKNSSAIDNSIVEPNSTSSTSQESLFDIDSKEIKFHTGIKTLSPVRDSCPGESIESKHQQYPDVFSKVRKSGFHNNRRKEFSKKFHTSTSTNQRKDQSSLQSEDQYQFDSSLLEENNDSSLTPNYIDGFSRKINDVIMVNGELIKVEKLRREEIINCTCGVTEEDGLMIQCDLCLCWQHGICNSIEKENDVPEKYICYICQHAHHQRNSKKYFQDQDWIRDGFLPSLCLRQTLKFKTTSATLKRLHDLIAALIRINRLLYSLRVKVNVVLNKNHPKLYLWAKNWNKIITSVIKSETIPLIEMIKAPENDISSQAVFEEKSETSSVTKNNISPKLITSDSELMKILEEDNIQVEENKLSALNSLKQDNGNVIEKTDISQDPVTKTKIVEPNLPSSPIKSETKPQNLKSKYATFLKGNLENSNHVKRNILDNKLLISSQPIIPQPEALIDPVECKLRLLQHIEQSQCYVISLLDFIEAQLSTLEDNIDEQENYCQHIQTIQMLSHDLITIKKLAAAFS